MSKTLTIAEVKEVSCSLGAAVVADWTTGYGAYISTIDRKTVSLICFRLRDPENTKCVEAPEICFSA